MNDDTDLLQKFVTENSQDAFRELVERYSRIVHSAAARILDKPGDATDISQIVFSALARKAAQLLKSKAILPGWLYRSAVYEALSHKARLKQRSARENHYVEMQTQPVQETSWPSIRPELDQAIAKLPQRLQEAVVLHFFEGKTQKEAAVILGCDADAIRKRVARSVDKLRDMLRRRGVTVSAIALTTYLASNTAEALPVGMTAASITKGALSLATQGGGAVAASSFLFRILAPKVLGSIAVGILTVIGITQVAKPLPEQPQKPDQTAAPAALPKTVMAAAQPKPSSEAESAAESLLQRFRRFIAMIKPFQDTLDAPSQKEMTDIAREYVVQGPNEAVDLSKEIPSAAIQGKFLSKLFNEWAKHDLKAAAIAAGALADRITRGSAINGIVSEWSKRDAPAAAEWLLQFPLDQSEDTYDSVGRIRVEWAETDPLATLEWLRRLLSKTNTELRYRGEVSTALSKLAKKDPPAAAAWIQKETNDYVKKPTDPFWWGRLDCLIRDMNFGVALTWAQKDSQSAANWLLNQIQQNPDLFTDSSAPWATTYDYPAYFPAPHQISDARIRGFFNCLASVANRLPDGPPRQTLVASLSWAARKCAQQGMFSKANQFVQMMPVEERSATEAEVRDLLAKAPTESYRSRAANWRKTWTTLQNTPLDQWPQEPDMVLISEVAEHDTANALKWLYKIMADPKGVEYLADRGGNMPGTLLINVAANIPTDQHHELFNTIIELPIPEEKKRGILRGAASFSSNANPADIAHMTLTLPEGLITESVWPEVAVDFASNYPQVGADWFAKLPPGKSKDLILQRLEGMQLDSVILGSKPLK